MPDIDCKSIQIEPKALAIPIVAMANKEMVGTINGTINVPVNDTIKLSQLTERQRKIYDIIKNDTINDTVNDPVNDPVNVPVNTQNLASMLGVSEKTIKRDIAAMQSAGIIKRVGSDKTGHWEIIDNK